MEKIDPVTFVATPVAQTGDVHSEICGAVYLGGGIFASTDLVFQGGTSAFTISSAGVVDFESSTPYKVRGLAYEDPVLPIELTSFISLVNTNNITLNWSTATETNNSGFEIERSNVRGQTSNEWIKVGNVTGKGTSTVGHSYTFTDKNLSSGNYNYRLKQIDFNGNFEYFNLSNEVNVGVPANFELSQNYPNPFNPTTKIKYQLPNDGSVNISVFDNAGKEVATLVNEFKSAGYYAINFNAASLSSGVYFYKISSGNFSSVKKMMLLK
ncbi:MAG: T9SS type A sorting domain-containing protein [Ignavibacteria bacterium]|nr:T9SS type A sorting domain-containing protein [Ignavibacteria bacterium]